MIEAVRALGMAARFVTGYIYSPASESKTHHGSGATHAWVEVFIPGAGWIDFDPTNGIIGSRDLIRVASVREALQAVPRAGTWPGVPGGSRGMSVGVHVTADASASTVPSAAPGAIPPPRTLQSADQAGAPSEIVQLSSRGKPTPQPIASHPSQNRCASEGSRNR